MAKRDARRARQPRRADPYLRYKIAMMPVLLVILVYVLLGGEGNDAPATGPAQPVTYPARASATTKPSGQASLRKWPEGDLELLSRDSPFASYRSEGKLRGKESRLVLQRGAQSQDTDPSLVSAPTMEAAIAETLRAEPVRYLFESETHQVVMLGERVLIRGDALNAAARIERIEQGKMILSPMTPLPATQPESGATEVPMGVSPTQLPNLFDLW